MNLDAQAVIDHLAQQIADQAVTIAMLRAQIVQLEQPGRAEPTPEPVEA